MSTMLLPMIILAITSTMAVVIIVRTTQKR